MKKKLFILLIAIHFGFAAAFVFAGFPLILVGATTTGFIFGLIFSLFLQRKNKYSMRGMMTVGVAVGFVLSMVAAFLPFAPLLTYYGAMYLVFGSALGSAFGCLYEK